MKKILILFLGFILFGFQTAKAEPEIPTIPEVSFSYASLHAIDHTHIVIPVSKGWHKDVGLTITPEPYGSSVGGDKIVAGLTSGFDVIVIYGKSKKPINLLKRLKSIIILFKYINLWVKRPVY